MSWNSFPTHTWTTTDVRENSGTIYLKSSSPFKSNIIEVFLSNRPSSHHLGLLAVKYSPQAKMGQLSPCNYTSDSVCNPLNKVNKYYFGTSLVAQMVKRLSTMWETRIRSLGREGPSTPVLLPGKSHGQRSLVGYSPWGHKETQLSNLHLKSTLQRLLTITSRFYVILCNSESTLPTNTQLLKPAPVVRILLLLVCSSQKGKNIDIMSPSSKQAIQMWKWKLPPWDQTIYSI